MDHWASKMILLVIWTLLHFLHANAQAPRGWYMGASGPVCSATYDGGTMDPKLMAQPPDTILSTWVLGDARAAPLVAGSKDALGKMAAAIASGKHDEGLPPLFAATYVEHSPFKPEDVGMLVAHLKSVTGPGFEYKPVIEMYEGPFAVILSSKKFSDKPNQMVVLDVWLSAGGKFYEHWDMMRELPNTPNSAGRTLIDPVTPGPDTTAEQKMKNKELVVNAINDYRNLKWPNSVDQYFTDDYMEHAIGAADGKAGLKDGIGKYADARWDIKMVIADKDLVFVLSRVTITVSGALTPYAMGEIFRVKDCKIAEHWLVTEKLPPLEIFKNRNGAF